MIKQLEVIEEAIQHRIKRAYQQQAFYTDSKAEIERLLNRFNAVGLELTDTAIATNSFDISLAGDFEQFKTLFKVLRSAGYNAHNPPQEAKFTSWSSFWTGNIVDGQAKQSHIRIWVNFTSTKCTQMIVGTKMVEQNIYETVCE